MYECPNCAANLKFDIIRQQLHCDYCDTTVNPYDFHKEQDAEETTEYEVTVFTCPQCNGEIISDETTAATFCSYCGSSTILDSRIRKEKLPKYIIPFSRTMDDCKASYAKMMRLAPFAPNELKDPEHIRKFRGIYMPYWVYSFEKKGSIAFSGTKSRRSGDYLYTSHYNLSCRIDAECNGIPFDGSSTFSDSLSNAIAPFDLRNKLPFVPSFLSGFYADTSDVHNAIYQEDAEEMIVTEGCKQIEKDRSFSRYKIKSLQNALTPECTGKDLAMFPVWFLTYRKNDRVAYAVVNGQTGAAAADLPVDPKKFLLGSLLLAIPLFIILNLFFTLKPTTILILSIILAILSAILANNQIARSMLRESNLDDKGLQLRQASTDIPPLQQQPESEFKKALKQPLVRTLLMVLAIPAISIGCMFVFMMAMIYLSVRGADTTGMMTLFFGLFICGYIFFIAYGIFSSVKKNSTKKSNPFLCTHWKKKMPTLLKPLLAILLALVIFIIYPVSDISYYIGAIICIAMSCITFLDLIKYHNILTTRKLPQFNKRGGDENA